VSAGHRVRPATSSDVDALLPLVLGYLAFYEVEREPGAVAAHRRARLDAGEARVLVAEASGSGPEGSEAVGFALAHPTWDTLELAPRWILHDLYVAPAHRRSGVARALLREMVAAARAAGASAISLETAHSNTAAQPLYESEGFERDLVYRTYHRELAGD
jgi:ribosomal protein S18 acetylase RimI-like enzyme